MQVQYASYEVHSDSHEEEMSISALQQGAAFSYASAVYFYVILVSICRRKLGRKAANLVRSQILMSHERLCKIE